VVSQANIIFIGARGFAEESEVVMTKPECDPLVVVVVVHGDHSLVYLAVLDVVEEGGADAIHCAADVIRHKRP